MAKRFFAEHSIEFTEKDLTTNEEFKKEMIEISGSLSVPVIVIGDEVIVGWNEPLVRSKLGVE